jgi:hypothetical protein
MKYVITLLFAMGCISCGPVPANTTYECIMSYDCTSIASTTVINQCNTFMGNAPNTTTGTVIFDTYAHCGVGIVTFEANYASFQTGIPIPPTTTPSCQCGFH